MSPITHALVGWCLAETVPRLSNRDRAIVVAAAVAPDIDGLGIIPELLTRNSAQPVLWWSSYHHVLAHNLLFACLVGLVAGVLAKAERLVTAVLATLAVILHLLCDLAGSRGPDGYDWPIPFLFPFASVELSWAHQWKLNAWQNMVITAGLLGVTFLLAWKRGYSPVGLFSARADHAFVETLRRRFPFGAADADRA